MRLYYSGDDADNTSNFIFCFPIKAVNSIEDFLRRRYNLYSDILYHHHVTKTDYLLMSSVECLIFDYLSSEKEGSESDAPDMFPFDISGLWHPLRLEQTQGNKTMNNNLVQWNDSWLMTVLKQIYYRDYENISFDEENDAMANKRKVYKQLSELLLNDKYYISLTKRSYNFKVLDNKIKDYLFEGNDLENQLKELRTDENMEDEALMMLYELQRYCRKETRTNSFVAQFLCKEYHRIHSGAKDRFYEIVEKSVGESLNEAYEARGISVEDFIIAPVDITVGINDKTSIYFYDSGAADDRNFLSLSDVSDIKDILNYKMQHFPPFYLYVALDDLEKNTHELEEKALETTGEKIARNVALDIMSFISNRNVE